MRFLRYLQFIVGKAMRFLLYSLVFIVGGAIGVYIGGAGWVATGVAGTQFGVCSAAKVAGQLGILTAEEQNRLLGETSGHLRSEFPEIAKKFGLADQPSLSLDRCAEFVR
ncbi:MAG: hypothetical protein U1E38_03605 [Rhodospirillales bacterium]